MSIAPYSLALHLSVVWQRTTRLPLPTESCTVVASTTNYIAHRPVHCGYALQDLHCPFPKHTLEDPISFNLRTPRTAERGKNGDYPNHRGQWLLIPGQHLGPPYAY